MKVNAIQTFFAALFALVVSVIAQAATGTDAPFYLTNPIQGASFKAGDTVTITWINGLDTSAKVTVITGTSASTMNPTDYTFTIEGSDGEYEWKVPTDLPQKATFAFKIDYTSEAGAAGTTYSSAFTVTGTTGDVVTESFVSTIPPTGPAPAPASVSVVATAISTVPTAAVSSAPVSSASVSASSVSATVAISSAVKPSSTASASTTPVPTASSAPRTISGACFVACVLAVIIASALTF